MRLEVALSDDHIERLTKARPSVAISEMIWNSLDADSDEVAVRLRTNSLGVPEQITVSDRGTGISFAEAKTYFGSLGGSWKQSATHTKERGRAVHGKKGEGRFRAFSLGEKLEWYSTSKTKNGNLESIRITNVPGSMRQFDVSEPEPNDQAIRGTELVIDSLIASVSSLDPAKIVPDLTREFALYLRKYSDAKIKFEGQAIDPASIESRFTQSDFQTMDAEGNAQSHSLTVIEWKGDMPRALCLCSRQGFTYREVPPGIHAKGYSFTAYLQSEALEMMALDGTIELEAFPPLYPLVEAAKAKLREHFEQREAEDTASLVERWKSEDIYPFGSEPRIRIRDSW